MIEEAIEENIAQINKDRVKALTRQKSKNTQPDQTSPITLLPKRTSSPEMDSRKSNRANRFMNKFGAGGYGRPYPGANATVTEEEKSSEKATGAPEHLRVSTVNADDEAPAKYIEIAMANQSDDDNGEENDDGESEADFYQPVGLSPMKTKVEEPGTQQSDTKFFQQLRSHRQE